MQFRRWIYDKPEGMMVTWSARESSSLLRASVSPPGCGVNSCQIKTIRIHESHIRVIANLEKDQWYILTKTIVIHTLNLNANGECKCKPHPSLCSQVLQESVPQQHPHCSGHQEGLEFAMVRPKVAVASQRLFARNSDMSMVSSRHSFGPITRSVSNARGIPASYHHQLHMLNPCQKQKRIE